MASTTKETPAIAVNDPLQRRLRHPLQTMRKYIRTYVGLEGLALILLFLAGYFWICFTLDYGPFRLFSFDWLFELRDVDATGGVGFWLRFFLLVAFILGFLFLFVSKVLLRWIREFNDTTMALLLERRFPRQLGDRLITAVEIHDPKQAEKYGFSAAMVEKTINDAAKEMERLPVADVFNWGRLARQWLAVLLSTVGVFLFVLGAGCVIDSATGGTGSPSDFLYRFRDNASIFGERGFLLRDTFWPRNTHLEVQRFQPSRSDANEMRIGRDDKRPELIVQAYEWVYADRTAPEGWRPLRFADLKNLVDAETMGQVRIPSDWPHWQIDIDELAPHLSPSMLQRAASAKTIGEFRAAALAEGTSKIPEAVEQLLDWTSWPIDRLYIQEERKEVRDRLAADGHASGMRSLFGKLQDLAAQPNLRRTIRQLEIPSEVMAFFRGKKTKASGECQPLGDRRFNVSLDDLSESVRFFVRGGDYVSPSKRIALVPPPTFTELKVDKEEPAYLYHRLQGDQVPLKGKKHVFKDFNLSVTGDLTSFDLPIGSDVTLKARLDRKLTEPIRMRAPAKRDAGSVVPELPVTLDADGKGFSVRLTSVTRLHDFVFHYQDEDNVTGRRRIIIRPIDDLPPEILNIDLAAVLRKPRFKTDPKRKSSSTNPDGYLITPDALLPLGGAVRDEYGITRIAWLYDLEAIDFELVDSGGPPRESKKLAGNPRSRRLGLAMTPFMFTPVHSGMAVSAAPYITWSSNLLASDLKFSDPYFADETVDLEEFARTLRDVKSLDEIPITALDEKLKQQPGRRPKWEHLVKDEIGFDVRKYIPSIKPREAKDGQVHFHLKLYVTATDNNVETGAPVKVGGGKFVVGNSSKSKTPINLLVVSENELLGQIAIEELTIFEKLGKILDRLKNGRTLLEAEATKIKSGAEKLDASLSALRMDEVRKIVLDNGSSTREIHQDYIRIVREMEVNRITGEKVGNIYSKIIGPLDDIVEPNPATRNIAVGNFVKAEESVQTAFQLFEEEGVANKGVLRVDDHLRNIGAARQQMDVLIDRLTRVHEAMDKLVDESRLIENLTAVERLQRQTTTEVQILRNELVRQLLEALKGLESN